MVCQEPLNCIIQYDAFDADPDIAGIGVVLGFAIPAWVCFTFVTVIYLGDKKRRQHFLLKLPEAIKAKIPNEWLQSPSDKPQGESSSEPETERENIAPSLKRLAVIVADQQLITGASILIVAISKHCTITQYHFQIAQQLSWLNLSTLYVAIRLSGDSYRNNSFMKSWRSAWLVGLTVLNISASVVICNAAFLLDGGFGLSTQCVWDRMLHPGPVPVLYVVQNDSMSSQNLTSASMANRLGRGANQSSYIIDEVDLPQYWPLDLGYLVYLVTIEILALPSTLRWMYDTEWRWLDVALRWLRAGIHLPLYLDTTLVRQARNIVGRPTECSRQLRYRPLRNLGAVLLQSLRVITYPLAFPAIAIGTILTSDGVDLIIIFLILLDTTITIHNTRIWAVEEGMLGDENNWGFGQLLPLLLLTLPLSGYLENVWEAVLPKFNGGTSDSSELLAPLINLSQPNSESPRQDTSSLTVEREDIIRTSDESTCANSAVNLLPMSISDASRDHTVSIQQEVYKMEQSLQSPPHVWIVWFLILAIVIGVSVAVIGTGYTP